jgi:hypothetical protein
VPIPPANIGSTKSSGVDITLTYNETISKGFSLSNMFTFTTSKNKVTATNTDGTARVLGGYYFNGLSQSVTVFEKGFTPGYFMVIKPMACSRTRPKLLPAPYRTAHNPAIYATWISIKMARSRLTTKPKSAIRSLNLPWAGI